MFNAQGHAARRVGEFDGVAENVQQHFLQLHVVADIVFVHFIDEPAFVRQAFVLALRHDHGVDLFQHRVQ